jgi:hypothetical protein
MSDIREKTWGKKWSEEIPHVRQFCLSGVYGAPQRLDMMVSLIEHVLRLFEDTTDKLEA